MNPAKKRRLEIHQSLVPSISNKPSSSSISISPTSSTSTTEPLTSISSLALGACRLAEIQRLAASIQAASMAGTKRVFQTLPKSLRRRTASHMPKRVPRNYRQRSLEEHLKLGPNPNPNSTISTSTCKSKSKCKSSGPKPRNLKKLWQHRTTLVRRPSPSVLAPTGLEPTPCDPDPSPCSPLWIETHIWHAKRMQMQSLWGYRIGAKNNRKTFRLMQKAATSSCLLHDLSYEQTFYLQAASQRPLLAFLSHMTEPASYPSPLSSLSSPSGQLWLYAYDTYPKGLIAPFSYTWLSLTHLLIWIHPAAGNEAWAALCHGLQSINATEKAIDYVSMHDLTGALNRFELIGPTSLTVLNQAIELQSTQSSEARLAQWPLLGRIEKPSRLVPDDWCYAGFARDPRLSRHMPEKEMAHSHVRPKKEILLSALRGGEGESERALCAFMDTLLCPMRPVPQKEVDVYLQQVSRGMTGGVEPSEPISFIMRRKKLTFGSSESLFAMELVVPSGWGMPFWRRLVYSGRGVQPASLLDRRRVLEDLPLVSVSNPNPNPNPCFYYTIGFPYHFVTTRSFEESEFCETAALKAKEGQRPKSKQRALSPVASPPGPGWLVSPLRLSAWLALHPSPADWQSAWALGRLRLLGRGRPQHGALVVQLAPVGSPAWRQAEAKAEAQALRAQEQERLDWFDAESQPFSTSGAVCLSSPKMHTFSHFGAHSWSADSAMGAWLQSEEAVVGRALTQSGGYSQGQGCGQSVCYVQASCLLKQGAKDRALAVWMVQAGAPCTSYPAVIYY